MSGPRSRKLAAMMVVSLFAALVLSWALPGTAVALSDGTSIYGTVTDSVTGELLPGVNIDLYDMDYNYVSWTEADENGAYELAVPDGDYYIVASGNGRYDTAWWIPVTADTATPTEKTITLNPRPRVVHGTVRDVGGDPISWGRVELYAETDDYTYDYWGYTDENGFYEVFASIPESTYLLTASASRYLSSEQDYAYDGTDASVDFALDEAPKAFTGVLSDASTGEPISGWVSASGTSTQGDNYDYWDYTESDGVYSIYFPAGTYQVSAGRSGYQMKDVGELTFDGVNTVTRNIALTPYPIAITGRVTNASNGAVVQGADVYFDDIDGISGYATIDAQGYYKVRAPNGTYQLRVTGERMTPQGASVTFSGTTVTRNFALQPAPKAFFGAVKDAETGDPIPNMQVELEGQDAATGFSIYDWTETDDQGAYSLYAPAGDHQIRVYTDNGHFGDSADLSFNGGAAVQHDFLLEPFPVAFTGTVSDADTTDPIAGAHVWVEFDGGDFYYSDYTSTEADGSYEIRMPAGTAYFEVGANGYASSYDSADFDGTEATVKDFALRPVMRAFFGQVTDFDTTDPVWAEVYLYYNDGSLEYEDWTETDDAGNYELFAPVGDSDIYCYASRYERASTSASFDGGDAVEVNFQPKHYPEAFTGTVTEAGSGLPLAETGVSCWFDTEETSYEDWDTTGESGQYKLYGPAGSYNLRAQKDRYARSSTTREFDGSSAETVNFVLTAYPKAFYGFVTQAGAGSAVGGAYVDASYDTDEDTYEDWTETGADGSYALYGPTHLYNVYASAEHFQSQRASLTFSGSAVRKDFALAKYPKAFYGVVKNAETLAPVADVEVGAFLETDDASYEDWDQTDAAGAYELYLPAGGSFDFHVHATGFEHYGDTVGPFDGTNAIEHNVSIVPYPEAIHGTVTNADTGKPMAGVWVYAWIGTDETDYEGFGITDINGDYQIQGPAGTYSVRPELPSAYADARVDGVVFDGTTSQQVDFDVTYPGADMTPPQTEIFDVPSGWVNHNVTFGLDAWDSGSGLFRTYYKLGSGSTQTYPLSPVTVSAEGATVVSYWSEDVFGNEETPKAATIRIDKTLPVTTSNAVASYTGSASIALSPTDAGGSALKATYWRVDGGAWNSGTAASAFGVGAHTLQFYSLDNAGNTEAVKSASFSIVGVPTFMAVTPSTTAPGTYGATVTFAGSLKRDSAAGAAVAGAPVAVRAFAAGAWTDVATLTTGADGSFSWAAAPLSTTTYQFVFAGNSTFASSPLVSVTIVPKASLAKVAAKRVSTRTYKLAGSVKAGAAAKTYVRVYRWKKVGSKWKAYKYVKVTAKKSGSVLKYSLKHKFPSKGTWRLQAVSPKDANHASSKSKCTYVKVK